MNSKLELFDALAVLLAEKVPEIKTFRLFNNQFEKEGVEKAFPFPAVFVEFQTMEYVSKSEALQEALNFWLQSFNIVNLATPFDRKRETQDTNHDGVIVWQIEYNTLMTDNSANRKNKMTLVVGVPELEINASAEPYYLKPS